MSDEINFLVTVLYEGVLIKCAIKIKKDMISEDCARYPMENRKMLHKLLPMHVQSAGPIVEIEELFEIHIAK